MFGCMRGSVIELGDIVGPMEYEPSYAELGIAYIGKNGPVYYTGKGTETTDDLQAHPRRPYPDVLRS